MAVFLFFLFFFGVNARGQTGNNQQSLQAAATTGNNDAVVATHEIFIEDTPKEEPISFVVLF